MATPRLGRDISCLTGLSGVGREVDGRLALVHALCRRLQTPRGHWPFAPDMGYDLRQLVGASFVQPGGLSLIASQIENELEKSERVASIDVTVTATTATDIDIRVEITDSDDDSFEFVVPFSSVTGALITQSITVESA